MKLAVIFVALACELVQAVDKVTHTGTVTVPTVNASVTTTKHHDSTISASVPMNSMTITIGIIFLL